MHRITSIDSLSCCSMQACANGRMLGQRHWTCKVMQLNEVMPWATRTRNCKERIFTWLAKSSGSSLHPSNLHQSSLPRKPVQLSIYHACFAFIKVPSLWSMACSCRSVFSSGKASPTQLPRLRQLRLPSDQATVPQNDLHNASSLFFGNNRSSNTTALLSYCSTIKS